MPRGIGTGVYVARESFFCDVGGEPTPVHAGRTRVREGHELLRRYPHAFEPADTGLAFEVEQATAAPGEKRGARQGV